MHINSNVMQKSHHCYCKDSTSVDLPAPFQIIFQGFGIIFLKFLQHHIGSWVEEGFWTDSPCSPRGTLEIYALAKAKQLFHSSNLRAEGIHCSLLLATLSQVNQLSVFKIQRLDLNLQTTHVRKTLDGAK